jgi:hypothetical protein
MRNLAIMALTDASRRVDEVARVFALTATYVSMLRGRARLKGSAGLVRRRGRPPKLSERQVAQAPQVGGIGLDPAGNLRTAGGGPLGDQRSARPGRPGPRAGAPDRDQQPLEPTVAEPDDTETTETETETGDTPVVQGSGSNGPSSSRASKTPHPYC